MSTCTNDKPVATHVISQGGNAYPVHSVGYGDHGITALVKEL